MEIERALALVLRNCTGILIEYKIYKSVNIKLNKYVNMQIKNSIIGIIIKVISEYYEGKERSYIIPYLVCVLSYVWLKILRNQAQEKTRRNLLEYIKLNSDLSYIYIKHAYKFKI